jgi:hypothetical protein
MLISIAAVAAALAAIAREVIGHAVAARVVGSDWFASSIFGEVNTPARIAGVCGTLANLVLGGMATLLLRLNKRFTSGWYFLWVFGWFVSRSESRSARHPPKKWKRLNA